MSHLAIVATNPAALSPTLRLAASGVRDSMSGFDDNARFASVVMPHIDAAYSLAHWLTGNRSDAEDVVQEASLRAIRELEALPSLHAGTS